MKPSYEMVDVALFVIANLVNVAITGIMLSRPLGLKSLERGLGWVCVACALPVGIGVVLNAVGGRGWWMIILPSLLVFFLVIELMLDYVLKIEFRNTRLLAPYLLVCYVAVNAMTGYAFLMGKTYGFVTLATYMLSLLATWYSYSKVGHGTQRQS